MYHKDEILWSWQSTFWKSCLFSLNLPVCPHNQTAVVLCRNCHRKCFYHSEKNTRLTFRNVQDNSEIQDKTPISLFTYYVRFRDCKIFLFHHARKSWKENFYSANFNLRWKYQFTWVFLLTKRPWREKRKKRNPITIFSQAGTNILTYI